jgi:GT2 family glycosyltransferase
VTNAKAPSFDIDVVVPVFNKRPLLERAVGSVAEAARVHGRARLWLIDNGSTDGSFELLNDRFRDQASVLQLKAGTISAVRNLGAAQGTAPIISFIDCDCLVPQNYFHSLELVLADTSIAATGCKVALPPEPTWVEATWNRMHDEGAAGPRNWINSGNFAVRRSAFSAVGGFNESVQTGEDSELCQRLRERGNSLVQDSRLSVAHLDNAKTLPAFFRKERWRGLGMFATVKRGAIDKPVAMTLLHLAATLCAVGVVAFTKWAAWVRVLSAGGLLLAAPFIAVTYRAARGAKRFNILQAICLYEVYFLARIAALLDIAFNRAGK